jgi:hypothetical protein
MVPSRSRWSSWPGGLKIALLGLVVFAVLTACFSPNWVTFYYGVREAKLSASNPAQSAAIDNAALSGYSARGAYVVIQAADLNARIMDPNHKIVRWRLLVPALGYLLNLPGWVTLGLAQLGCLVLSITLVGVCLNASSVCSFHEAMCFSIVAGASAPFFTSMGLLGYYDAWVALALVAVSFARRRWIVLLSCFLAPWIDERFVIGLPLALWVRWIRSDSAKSSHWLWFKREATFPIILVGAYTILRLGLGGSGGSQTVREYLNEFVFARELSLSNYIVGAWEGLRVGWVFVAAAILGSWVRAAPNARFQATILAIAVMLTALIGMLTALDLSRSMALLFPVLPLGWIYPTRIFDWKKFHVTPVLAAMAIILPARHVVGGSIRPVDNLWSPPTPLTHFQNTLGARYLTGDGVSADSTEALKWFRQAANQGLPEAQYNLGLLYARGNGIAQDATAAVKWYRLASDRGYATAQYALAVMYALGTGVTKNPVEAVKWYRKAAEQGHVVAQSNLGAKYFAGIGVAQDNTEALRWFRKAAEQGYAPAQSNLGVMYFRGDGVEKNLIQATAWWQLAAAQDLPDAKSKLAMIEKELTAEQRAEATALVRERLAKGGAGKTGLPR